MGRLRRGAAAILMAGFGAGAAADEATEGRPHYVEVCMKCHGLLKADPDSWTSRNLASPAVVMPLGPSLADVFGRPAGVVETYGYSRSFREALENPWVWDGDALDAWIADSQAFVSGTTMYVKVPDEAVRARIVAYLAHFAPWAPE